MHWGSPALPVDRNINLADPYFLAYPSSVTSCFSLRGRPVGQFRSISGRRDGPFRPNLAIFGAPRRPFSVKFGPPSRPILVDSGAPKQSILVNLGAPCRLFCPKHAAMARGSSQGKRVHGEEVVMLLLNR